MTPDEAEEWKKLYLHSAVQVDELLKRVEDLLKMNRENVEIIKALDAQIKEMKKSEREKEVKNRFIV